MIKSLLEVVDGLWELPPSTHTIHMASEEQKKLEQVLKRLKQRDVQSYFLSVLQEQWLRLS